MNRQLLQLFCFLNLIILHHAVDYGKENLSNQQVYNLNALFAKGLGRLQSSLRFSEESPRIDLQFGDIDPDIGLQQHGNLLQNSSKCVHDIIYIFQNIKNQWALNIIDSFGKPESGILIGNFKWVGDYNECVQVRSTNPKSTTVGNFRGRYCSVTWSLPVPKMPSFVTGICVPDSCSTSELQSAVKLFHVGGLAALNDTLFALNVTDFALDDTKIALDASIKCKPTERHLIGPAKAVIALLSIFCTLAVVGSSITVVNYFKKVLKESKRSALIANVSESYPSIGDGSYMPEKDFGRGNESLLQDNTSVNQVKGKLETFFSCFCMFTNGAKILNTDSSEGQLLCIHGIRFLSMSWVILGHTYAFSMGGMRNLSETLKLIDNFPFQVVLQGFYSVDSFFVLSGFLLTYLFMKEFSKTKGVMSWPYFYIHRYVRLTPMYMIILGFSATVYFYIGSGPFWIDQDYDPICRDGWWWNLLYINNFRSLANQCMGWSWYLANDMQFFVISPIFLITLWRWPPIGYALLSIFWIASYFANFLITYHYELAAGMTSIIGDPNISDLNAAVAKNNVYMDKIYIKPYTRIGPYLVGILVGYILFKRKSSNRPKLSWGFISGGWLVATVVTLVCVYGLYDNHPGVTASSFYNALNRTCFAAGLSWVIYVCLIGQGGVVNSILSYKLFIPLSRLTYAAYLIHPMIINGYYASLKTTLEFSHPTMVFTFLGMMVVTYALALPVALILESPIVSLEKLVRKAFAQKKDQHDVSHIPTAAPQEQAQ